MGINPKRPLIIFGSEKVKRALFAFSSVRKSLYRYFCLRCLQSS